MQLLLYLKSRWLIKFFSKKYVSIGPFFIFFNNWVQKKVLEGQMLWVKVLGTPTPYTRRGTRYNHVDLRASSHPATDPENIPRPFFNGTT